MDALDDFDVEILSSGRSEKAFIIKSRLVPVVPATTARLLQQNQQQPGATTRIKNRFSPPSLSMIGRIVNFVTN